MGDAILLFFGDPETKRVAEDARACLEIAVEMQKRLRVLNKERRKRCIKVPFEARMGINTGICNVCSFGSEDRMDYKIIGAEANLAARLQAIAAPGGIVMSYEAFALVRDLVRAHPPGRGNHRTRSEGRPSAGLVVTRWTEYCAR